MEKPDISSHSIPWGRILAEGVVILVSILLALAADAWWDGRQTKKAEVGALERLSEEFRGSATQLQEKWQAHLDVRAAAEALFEFCGGESRGVPAPDSMYELLIDLVASPTYDPANGALNSLITSGRLEIISNDSLRVALAGWPSLVADLNEDEEAGWRDVDLRLLPYLDDHIAWRSLDRRSTVPDWVPSRGSDFPSGWDGIFRDRLFENLVDLRRSRARYISQTIDSVEAELSLIRRLLDQELRR